MRNMVRKRSRSDKEDTYPRVTLPLAKDTVETIKEMEWAAGFRGAGRTVDSLVEAVADSAEYIEAFIRAGVTAALLQNNPRPPDQARAQQIQMVQGMQMINAAVVIDRLRKFVGVDTRSIANEVKKQLYPKGLTTPPPGVVKSPEDIPK
jgi:hypothetical protein